ncbi:MAG TPA: aldehyde dehydrogenase family protein, partial [Methylomirabilota bacterium]|nr:aldehyde dehydrogenase family protein [Methylomirabilota bacterium]
MALKDPKLFRQQCYINGKWVDADSKRTVDVNNPATAEILGTVPYMGATETRRAIEAANAAWPAWRKKTAKERANILRKWFNLMMENQEDLAVLMTAEQGKPLAESKGEIAYGASFVEWFAEEGKRIYGDTIPQHQPDKRIVVIKEPIGVVAAITPWNFPAAMMTRKLGPAMAAGCTSVVKPASATPLTAGLILRTIEDAGAPPGVVNLITSRSSSMVAETLF